MSKGKSSSNRFADIWHDKIESMIHNLESQFIFRLLIFETLLGYWHTDVHTYWHTDVHTLIQDQNNQLV